MNTTDTSFRPDRVIRPREQVELQLRNAVLRGEFRPGDKLPSEAMLAKQFGVSRSTIREALSALAEAGFIRTVPGATGGSFVAAIDYRSLSDSFGESVENILRVGRLTYAEVAAVRMVLEVPSARLAARTRTDEDLVTLESIVGQEKQIAVSDPAVPRFERGVPSKRRPGVAESAAGSAGLGPPRRDASARVHRHFAGTRSSERRSPHPDRRSDPRSR